MSISCSRVVGQLLLVCSTPSKSSSFGNHRSLLVPLSTRLVFDAPPTAHAEPVGVLASVPQNKPYLELQSWLKVKVEELQNTILPLGHKDADARRRANLGRLQYQVTRLKHILDMSWDHAKILAKVPGYYVLSDAKQPVFITPRESYVQYLYSSHVH